MAEARQVEEYFHFLYDPQIYGYSDSFFTTISGAPSISANKIRLTSASIVSNGEYCLGEVEFLMNIPVAPVAGQSKTWGLYANALGNINAIYFNITGAVMTAISYDRGGVNFDTTTITWDASWTAAAVSYKIMWFKEKVEFYIAGVRVASHTTYVPNELVPVPVHIVNGNADNLDISYIKFTNVRIEESPDEVGDISIGTINVDAEGKAPQNAAVTGNPMQVGDESATFDGASLPDPVTADGVVVRPKATWSGVAYVMPVNADGSKTPLAQNATTQVILPIVENIGGEYNAVLPTHAEGDTAIAQFDAKGELVVDSEYALETSMVDTTDLAVATYYYPSSSGLAMQTYKDFSITGKLICAGGIVTMTVEGTNDDVAADWIQVYGYDTKNNVTVNSIAANAGTTTFSWDFDNWNYKFVRVAVVVGNATNTVIIKARQK